MTLLYGEAGANVQDMVTSVCIGNAYGGAVRLNQLRYFVAVADARNFTRAAEALHLAQPSLSTQVRNLEKELGTPLLDRARNNLSLTPAGEVLLPLARRILADVEGARLQVRELANLERGRVRIGATPSLARVLLPAAVSGFASDYPGVEILIEERGSRGLVRQLADGALDVAFVIVPLHTGDPSLVTRPLLAEPLVGVVSRQDRAWRGRSDTTLTELLQRPLVMAPEGFDLRVSVQSACRELGLEPAVAVQAGSLDALLALVASGVGPSVVPGMVVDGHRGLRRLRLVDPPLERSVAVAHRRDVPLSATASAFCHSLEQQLRRDALAGRLPAGVTLPDEEDSAPADGDGDA